LLRDLQPVGRISHISGRLPAASVHCRWRRTWRSRRPCHRRAAKVPE